MWNLHISTVVCASGAGTNLKVGAYFVVPLNVLALQVHLVVSVSAFVMVSTVWSVSVCCSSTHSTLYPAICKSGGTCPLCSMESAPLVIASANFAPETSSSASILSHKDVFQRDIFLVTRCDIMWCAASPACSTFSQFQRTRRSCCRAWFMWESDKGLHCSCTVCTLW